MVHASADMRSLPLDFAYRVQGGGPAIGVVFDDGKDVFLQPVHPLQASSLRVADLPHVVQGPYLVIRGLSNRIEVSTGASSASTVIEYRGKPRPETAIRGCSVAAADEQRATIPFGTGSLRTEPGGFDHLAKVIAIARSADRVTIVSQGDRPDSAIAVKRAAHVRELLLAAGVAPASITEQVRPPAASSVHVVALRNGSVCPAMRASGAGTGAAPTGAPNKPALARSESMVAAAGGPEGMPVPHAAATRPSGAGVESMAQARLQAVDPATPAGPTTTALSVPSDPSPDLRLRFQPNTSVQATLRSYLSAHGMAVEFRRMPVLMVEEFAEVSGADVREVLRRALSRLGLRGELQGNRLLVVELAR